MRTVTVHVRREHLARGERYQPVRNPIALALAEVAGFPVMVDRRTALLIDPADRESRHTVRLPAEAVRWLFDFDRGGDPRPFAFALDLPEWAQCPATRATEGRTGG